MKKRIRNSFKTPLVVEVLPSGRRFKLYYPFTYRWHRGAVYRHSVLEIVVPRGFETDFASIPVFARWLIQKLGRYNKAAVIHDAIYQDDYSTPNCFPMHDFTRKEADIVFRDGMRDLGVAPWKRFLMFWAVRLFAWVAWRIR